MAQQPPKQDDPQRQPGGILNHQPFMSTTGKAVYDDESKPGGGSASIRRSEGLEGQTASSTSPSSTARSASSLQAAEESVADRLAPRQVDADPQWYTGSKNNANNPVKLTAKAAKMVRSSAAKKWGVGVLIGLVMGGGGITVVNIASGPAEFIHAAKLMEQFHFKDDQDFMDERSGRLIIRGLNANGSTRLGVVGNKIATRYETKLTEAGIKPGYENGNIKTLTIDTKTPEGKRAREKMLSMGMSEADLKPNSNGVLTISIDKDVGIGSTRYRRMVIRGMVGTLQMNGFVSAMASRSLQARAKVDYHPLKNIERRAQEKIEDYNKRVREERDKGIRNGVEPTKATYQAEADADDETNPGANDEANGAASEANDLAGDVTNPNETVAQRSSRLKAKLTGGVGVTGYLAMVCSAQAIGNEVGAVRHANVVLPLIRSSIWIMAAGNQAMSNRDMNASELGAYKEEMYDKTTKTSWIDARSIQAELHKKQTGPDMPDAAKPGNAKKPVFFQKIDGAVAIIPGGATFCKAVNSTTGGFILSAAGIALSGTPVGAVINLGTEVGQTLLANAFLDDLIRWMAGEQLAMDAKGALRGNYMNYGGRLAANDAVISHGGRALSKKEEFDLVAERNAIEAQQQQNQSFYARYFDLNQTTSLAARIMFETPALTSKQAMIDSAGRVPGNVASALATPFTSLFNKTAGAAAATTTDSGYDYGFPQYGFSVDEINNPLYEDPYSNAAIVEPKLADLNDKYGDCFATRVDPDSFKLVMGETKRYDEIADKCNDSANEELTRYRFYLADVTVAKALACYEGIDEGACSEIGFGSPSADNGTATSVIDTTKLYEDSTKVACAAGAPEVGNYDGYHDGKLVRVKICLIPGFKSSAPESNNQRGVTGGNGQVLVNSRVSGAYLALFQAAKGAGVTLAANSSFRTMEGQQAQCPCDGVHAAKPGYSNHQMGLAIDFAVPDTNNAIHKGDTWYKWLSENAERYGIKPYDVEDWHWSPTGS